MAALDEVGMPDDEPFREAVRSHSEFGSRVAMQNSRAASDGELHPLREVPRWTWEGDRPRRRRRAEASRRSSRRLPSVTDRHKPHIEVPPDQSPSYRLEWDDLEVGEGDEAVAGRQVEVHYVGVSWSSGEQFDASWDRGKTFKFKLGKGQVIAGWDQGVAGMRVGGRRRITIPPNLAYGKRGAGGVIGPDETLVFVVDLEGVR